MATKKIKIIDLFAGVGGLSYGFAHDDDFDIIAANEILPNMAKAYELNHPNVKMYCKDIKDFGIEDLTSDFWLQEWDVDLVVWWPPCQAYSTIGKREDGDPRGQLFREYYRVLNELKPKAFIFENVKWLLSMQNWNLLKTMIKLFESLEYTVSYKVLNAADFWAPQIRERVIIIGTKKSKKFVYPKLTHYNPKSNTMGLHIWLLPYLTLGEAIGDLPLIKSWESSTKYATDAQNAFQKKMRAHAPKKLVDHVSPKNNDNLIALMEQLPDGWCPRDLPEEMRPKSWFWNTYCKLRRERPSTTITRNLSTPSSSRCIHPKAPRPLTTREWARLQCFPDDYIFYWSRSDKNLQIGNAVNTFLSTALKDAIKEHFSKE